MLVNASQEFKKGKPKNYIPDKSIQKIAGAFIKGDDVKRFVKVIKVREAKENDYNLSPSRYVDTSEKVTYRPIPEILNELDGLEKKAVEIDKDLKSVFKKLGMRR